MKFGFQQLSIIKFFNRFLVLLMIGSALITSCESDPHDSNWVSNNSFSISQYIEKNRDEYSKFHKLMDESKMLNTLYAYNPYGNDYTLFLPTNEAIDNFIQQNQKYASVEELISDTGFIKTFIRYHTINNKVHTDEFPDGALLDNTLTGDRIVTRFYTDGSNQIIIQYLSGELRNMVSRLNAYGFDLSSSPVFQPFTPIFCNCPSDQGFWIT